MGHFLSCIIQDDVLRFVSTSCSSSYFNKTFSLSTSNTNFEIILILNFRRRRCRVGLLIGPNEIRMLPKFLVWNCFLFFLFLIFLFLFFYILISFLFFLLFYFFLLFFFPFFIFLICPWPIVNRKSFIKCFPPSPPV